ncbi:hypothetical protein GCM10010423_65400 [Streptomyces levis]|uniref:Uncharacterized protein n=1 Tax=Streptomyces levis TaxID=285566 RepID=A0ABP6BBW4_9ACTN
MSSNYQHIFEQIAHVAAPYVIYWSEDFARDGVVIELNDEDRGQPEESFTTIVRNMKIQGTTDVGGLFTRAVMHAKQRLQEQLAKKCDEPELRLWLAQNRDADFMDNSKIPQNLRKLYQTHLMATKPVTVGIDPSTEEGSVAVKTRRGVPLKEQPRKKYCPVHKEDEMVFRPEQGKWKCSVKGCKIVARPKEESNPVGQVMVGKGKLDLRVVFPEDGGEPSIIIMADNNVALDVTSLVDLEKFREWNDYLTAAKQAKRAGESVTAIPKSYSTLLLKFSKPAKVFGCEYS